MLKIVSIAVELNYGKYNEVKKGSQGDKDNPL